MKKEKYYKVPFDMLSIVGWNFGKYANDERVTQRKILKSVGFVWVFLTIFQELMFFADEKNPPYEKIPIVTYVSYMLEAMAKFTSVTLQEQKITSIINRIENIRQKMTLKQQAILDSSAKPLRDFAQWIGVTYVLCIQCFNILPALTMFKVYLSGEEYVYLHPFPFWYPFEKNNYFICTYTFEMSCGFVAVLAIAITDVLYLLMLAKVIGIYDSLSFSVEDLINQNEVSDHRKFKEIIEIHVETNEIIDALNDTFGITSLIHVALASVIMCFATFIILTQRDLMLMVQLLSVLLASLSHTFLFCWFGTKIVEKVRQSS